MVYRRKRFFSFRFLAVGVGVGFIGIFLLSRWINEQIALLKESDYVVESNNSGQEKNGSEIVSSKSTEAKKGIVICKVHLDPNRKHSLSLFYIDGVEIARIKSNGDNVLEQIGTVPDGKVEFQNMSSSTYGTEYYRNGMRHGRYEEYYENGNINKEALYYKGRKRTNREYFIDGTLRMEEDLDDALYLPDKDEVGVGKIYHRDGSLMYEWRLTNREQGGFNKSYDRNGRMVKANYFDEKGNLIDEPLK